MRQVPCARPARGRGSHHDLIRRKQPLEPGHQLLGDLRAHDMDDPHAEPTNSRGQAVSQELQRAWYQRFPTSNSIDGLHRAVPIHGENRLQVE